MISMEDRISQASALFTTLSACQIELSISFLLLKIDDRLCRRGSNDRWSDQSLADGSAIIVVGSKDYTHRSKEIHYDLCRIMSYLVWTMEIQ
jgi:hypothetical protein